MFSILSNKHSTAEKYETGKNFDLMMTQEFHPWCLKVKSSPKFMQFIRKGISICLQNFISVHVIVSKQQVSKNF